MKKFTTFTDVQLLNLAYHTLLEKWLKEQERYEANPSELAKTRADNLRAKLDELHNEIIRLENQK